MSKVFRLGAAVALAAVMILPAHAQVEDQPVEEPQDVVVVVTAERTAQPASESIASTTVVTARQIKEQGAQTVADVLRLVPGVTLRQRGTPGAVASALVRGTGSNQVLVLVDGQRITSPAFANTDMSKIPLADVTRVEVIRGPVSSLYGSDATGGVVNVITRKPTEPSGNATYSFGSNGRTDQALSLSGADEGLSWRLTGSVPEFEGDRPNSAYSATNASAIIGLAAVDGWEMTLRGETYQDSLGLPGRDTDHTGYYDPDDHMWWDRRNVGLMLKREIGDERLEIQAYRIEQELHNLAPTLHWLTGEPVVYDSLIGGTTDAVELSFHTGKGPHEVVFGGEYRKDRYRDAESGPDGNTLQHERISNHALFIQDRWNISEKADVVMGARLDDHSTAGSKVTPRAGISYAIASDSRLRLSYAEGFRAPNFVELYYPVSEIYGPGYGGNPDLKPEKSRQYEIGLNVQRRKDAFDIALFNTRVRDLIQATFLTPHENVGRARQRGIEVSWSRRLSDAYDMNLSYSYVDARDLSNNALLTGVPHNRLALTLSGMVESWHVGLAGRWTSDIPDVGATADGHIVVDLSLQKKGNKLTNPYVVIRNLFDTAYEEVYGYPAEGFSVEAGVRTAW